MLIPIDNNNSKDTKTINSNKRPISSKSNPFSDDDESFLSSVPNFDDKSLSNSNLGNYNL